MKVQSFLSFVEIKTKTASVTPFLVGALYTLYRFKVFDFINFMLFFISLISFDMATTALNNYFDYKRAEKKHGYNYEMHNAIVHYKMKETSVRAIIVILLVTAVSSGIALVFHTNILVLFIGVFSFLAGILYSFGPVPISRTPLGELLSGTFMGFVIVFLSVYVHVYDMNVFTLNYQNQLLQISMNLGDVIRIFFVSLPAVTGIANIMLANNICDIEDDKVNRRYTLPNYIGKNNALKLFEILYYIAYVDLVVLAVLRVIPVITLAVLLTLIPVYKNIRKFNEIQTKKDTFILAVKNFMLICLVQAATLGIAEIFRL